MHTRERKQHASERERLLAALGLAALAAVGAWLFWPSDTLSSRADRVIAACRDADYPPACYEREIEQLRIPMEDAFAVASLAQSKLPDYFSCHALGHRLAAGEVAKDPSQWTEVLARCPTGVCSNGCLHGAAQERFRKEAPDEDELLAAYQDLIDACKDSETHAFTPLARRECRHGMGHLALYLTHGDVEKAVDVCATVTAGESGEHARACYEGVFMQLTRPLDAEDVALSRDVAPRTPEAAKALCDSFDGAAQSACHTDAWAFSLWEGQPPSLAQVDAVCAEGPAEWDDRCHTDLTGGAAALLGYDWDALAAFCSSAEGEKRAQCFANAAFAALFNDRHLAKEAVGLCGKAGSDGDRCYRGIVLFSAYGFHPGSADAAALCELLPGAWKESCLDGDGEAMVSAILSAPQ